MSAARPDPSLLNAAAEWVIRLHYDKPDDACRQEFARWLAQSEAHHQAWNRAQAVLGTFDRMPAGLGREVLRVRGNTRRAVLRTLVGGAVLLPAAGLLWHQLPRWQADFRTATGERRTWMLADGSQLLLNTATTVALRFSAAERRLLLLEGELLLTSGPSQDGRPLLVQTGQGEIEALGTRFVVRQHAESTQVAVFEHAVELRPDDAPFSRLQAGQGACFTAGQTFDARAVDGSSIAWEQGMLVVRDWRLADVLAELGRYRRGLLRCDPEVADRRVSGALSVTDTDAALALLATRLNLRVRRLSPYWVSLGAA